MFKNKTEREAFLQDYRSWKYGQICNIDSPDNVYPFSEPLFSVHYHMHKFKNGAIVIVTECGNDTRYNLIIPDDDNYNPWDTHSGRTPGEFKTYNLTGVSIGTIVDYMTKRKDVI